jgi:two-component system sensor kinase
MTILLGVNPPTNFGSGNFWGLHLPRRGKPQSRNQFLLIGKVAEKAQKGRRDKFAVRVVRKWELVERASPDSGFLCLLAKTTKREDVMLSTADWLPARFKLESFVSKEANYESFLARDLETDGVVHIESMPGSRFNRDDLFHLEVFHDQAKEIDSECYIPPLDWGIFGDPASTSNSDSVVYLARPHLQDIAPLSLIQKSYGSTALWPMKLNLCDEPLELEGIVKKWMSGLEQLHRLNITQQDFRLSQTVSTEGLLKQLCPSLTVFSKPENRDKSWSLDFGKTASPELLGLIDHDVNAQSDIYSAGIVLYALLTGHLPFTGNTLSDVLVQQLTTTIEPEFIESGRSLFKIVKRMLEKNPKDRYQSFASIIKDLEWLETRTEENRNERFVAGWSDTRDSVNDPVLVGRGDVRKEFLQIFNRVRSGHPQRALLKSDEGLGKTRLLTDLLKESASMGFRTWRSSASEEPGQEPFAPLAEIVSQFIGDLELCGHLETELAEDRNDVEAFFPELAQALWQTNSETGVPRSPVPALNTKATKSLPSTLADSFERKRRSKTVCNILSKVARGQHPAVFWIDDCQWLDTPTVEVIEMLSMGSTDHLLIILSATESPAVQEHQLRLAFDSVIELQPLTDVEIEQLLHSMAGELPQEATHTICNLAAGSPFMAEALLNGMVETGALSFKDSQWLVDPELLDEIQASSDATEALLHRLKRLPKEVLTQLSVAAITGKSFSASTISAVSKVPIAKCYRDLMWARQQRLIWSKPDGTYAFFHDRIRNALVEKISDSQQRKWNAQLAEHFALTGANPIDIATHFDRANLPTRALAPALNAANIAKQSSSLDTALRMWLIAWKGIPDSELEQKHEVSASIGETLMLNGEYEKGDAWFRIAEETAGTPLAKAQVTMQRGEILFKQGDKVEAVGHFESALSELGVYEPKSWFMRHACLVFEMCVQLLHTLFPWLFLHRHKVEASDRDRLIWRIYSQLSSGYWYTQTVADTFRVHLCGMNRAETYPPTVELAQAWSDHSPGMSLFPYFSRGSKYSLRSLQVRKKLNDEWGQGQTRNFYSILLHGTSRYEQCISEAKQAEEILLRTGDYWELHIARYQHAAALYRLGHLNEALELAKRTYDDAMRIGDYQSTGNILDLWARAGLGDIPLEIIRAEKDRGSIDKQLRSQVLLAEGICHLEKKSFGAALVCLKEGIKVARKAGVCNSYTAPCHAWLATAKRLKLESEQKNGTPSEAAIKKFIMAAKRAVRVGRRFRNDLPHALRELAYAFALQNKSKAAKKTLAKSLAVAHAQKASYEVALTQQAFARLDLRFHWRSTDHVSEMNLADRKVREFEAKVVGAQQQETVSIISRFDALLDAGRKISSSLNEEAILRATIEASKSLLRGERTLIIKRDEQGTQWEAWRSNHPFDKDIVSQALLSNSMVVHDKETLSEKNDSRPKRRSSVLCSPIIANGSVKGCLYVANSLIEGMFGSDEMRIAEFIVNAAGSSLEKEASFKELDQLNASLEEKVQERTRSLESRTRELEFTTQQLQSTQYRLEQAAEEAQAANQTKSDFLAKMSHEIRTPISAVLGFAQLILRGVITDKETQLQKIAQIESNGLHLLQLVNDLLDISKIEADMLAVESIVCEPIKITHEVVESLKARAIENGNDLKLELSSPLPKTINSDPKRFRQILTNLIGNAIKFTSDGTIEVRVSFEGDDESMLSVEVADSGIGMTPEQLANVFTPFVQADSSITRRFGGTGLGLSISQELATALGGSIETSSIPGEGTIFHLRVSAGKRETLELLDRSQFQPYLEKATQCHWNTADLSSLNVLLADDAETNRDLISLVLRDCGATVTLVENGRQAVDAATASGDFDLVLMDMQMPELDGYSATRKLRELGYETPIFALTANSMTGDREKCLEAGCNEYLTKPIDLNLLIETLADVANVATACRTSRNFNRGVSAAHEAIAAPRNTAATMEQSPVGQLQFDSAKLDGLGPIRCFALQFLGTLKEKEASFVAHIDAQEQEEAAGMAHWLKGTSGTVMLSELSAAAKELESAIRANDWDAAKSIYNQIEQYTAEGLAFIATIDPEVLAEDLAAI